MIRKIKSEIYDVKESKSAGYGGDVIGKVQLVVNDDL